MKSQTIYQIDEKDLVTAMEIVIKNQVKDIAFSRFEGRKVSSQTASEILNVSLRTIYRYVGAGLIVADSKNEKEEYKFDLRHLLEFSKSHK